MVKNLTLSLNKPVRIFLFLALAIMAASCNQPKKMINNGNYDQAIDLLVEKSLKSPSTEQTMQLEQAFRIATSKDLERIHDLKSSGQPDVWFAIYKTYVDLDQRQQKIAQLPPEVLGSMDFALNNYDPDIEYAREKAASYAYALAQKQLSSGDDDAHAEAWDNLKQVQSVYPGFRDVEELLNELESRKPLYVYYAVENYFPGLLPPGIDEWFQRLQLSDFDVSGYHFVSQQPADPDFKVYAEIRIMDVKIAPGKTGELAYTESVEMQDGVAYKLDESGGFVLDSNGNKIEIPKFETLACFVTEYKQTKSMLVLGEVEIFDRSTGNSLGRRNISGEAKFEHLYAKFKGDLDALSAESKALVGTKRKDFPTDSQLIRYSGMRLAEDAAKKITLVLDNVE